MAVLTASSICIAALNDNFRKLGAGEGRIFLTHGVSALSRNEQMALMTKVRGFTDFNEDNDPHGEHDFGAIDFDCEKYFFKIDYYDLNYKYGSEDPCDPVKTRRVLTVMRANEY